MEHVRRYLTAFAAEEDAVGVVEIISGRIFTKLF